MFVFDVHNYSKNREDEYIFLSLENAYHFCAKLYCECKSVETLPSLAHVKESLKKENVFKFDWVCELMIREIVDADVNGKLTLPPSNL